MLRIRVFVCVLLLAAGVHISDTAFVPSLDAATETVPRESRIAGRLAALPPSAISPRHSFVLASEGESFLFNPSAGVFRAPFLPEVYKPFGFSSDSRYFLYLKSNGRLPAFSLYAFDLAERADKLISGESVQYAVWSPVTLHAAFISLESATRFRLSVHDLASGSTRQIYAGKIDPEYLEWSPDGRRLFFASVAPEDSASFHDQSYEYQVHEYQVFGNRAARSFPSRWAHLNEGLVSLGRNAAEVNRRLAVSGAAEVRRLKVSTDQVYASALENGEIVTRKLNADTGSWERLGPGEIYTATDDGVVLRSFAEGGVAYQYFSNSSLEPVQRLAFTGVFMLPYQGSAYLVQGGQSYRGGACDGRDCLVIAHKNLLGYGLDFQQTSEEGQGNQHILAVADGTVVATANNVTCNTARTSCVVGWDDYSTNCPSNDGAGNYVVIAHPDGTYSLYAHLKSGSVQVAPNQAVTQGTYLGIQGHSGSANSSTGYRNCGDHLHFQRQTGPAVWSQSIPTDFVELPCAPSCMTAHLSSNLERDPAGVSQLTVVLSPSTVIGSLTTTANRVLLSSPAPSGGATVLLSSSDPARAAVPASVVVPAGSTEGVFPINVNGNVTVTTNVTIGATQSGTTASAVLKVAPPKLGLIQLRSSAVTGGTVVNNNDVALTGYASADVVVPLTSSVPSALTVPQSVTVPSGATMANFNLQTYVVTADRSVKVSASAGGVTKDAYITVKAGGTPVVAVSVSPKTANLLTGQTQSFTATVTGASNTSVTWSIQPDAGSISSTGLYTAPSSVNTPTTVTVRATSVADSTKYDEATVTVSPPPPPAGSGLPFSDDFSSGSLGNWTIVDEGVTDKPSRWQIQSGVLHQTSNIYSSSSDGAARGTYALAGQSTWADYTVSLRMQSTDDDGIGVMFGYKDAKNYYRFAMDQSRSLRRLIKMVNGTPVVLAGDTVAYQQGRWYQVRATMANGVIEIAVDGQALFRVNDSTHTAGKIALYSWCNAGSQYDDVTVSAAGGSACSYSISPTEASVGASSATGTVSVSTGAGCAWNAASAATWISIISGASGSGNGVVGYSVQANTATTSRQGTLTVAGRTFTITQAGASAANTISFFDDFSSGSLGNWTIVDEGVTDKPSRWQIQSGVLHQTSNIYSSSSDGAARGTYALAGQSTWADYTVSLRMQSTDDDGIGVMFGYKDAKNYYRFAMDQSRSLRRLIKMVNGTPVVLAGDTVAYQQGRWYQVRATMANGVIEIAVDGQALFRVNDSTHTAGKIALYSWCNAGSQYDDVTVNSISP